MTPLRAFATSARMIRVLLVDDHDLVRDGLQRILEEDGDIRCLQAISAAAALEILHGNRDLDLVLLDINMPGITGMDALPEIRRRRPALPVLFLSLHPEGLYGEKARRLGAQGYLSKNTPTPRILEAVRRVAAGGTHFADRNGEEPPVRTGASQLLTEREQQVMRLIGSGKTNADIASMLGLSPKTVGTYRERILEKTGLSNNLEIIRHCLCEGMLG